MICSTVLLLAVLCHPAIDGAFENESWLDRSYKTGDACAREGSVVMGHGTQFINVTGSVEGQDIHGAHVAVRRTKFWYVLGESESGPLTGRRLKAAVKPDGSFSTVVGVHWDEHVSCQGGALVIQRCFSDVEVLVRAKECEDKVTRYRQGMEPLDIVLRCYAEGR